MQFEISHLTAPVALDFAHQLNCADIGEEVEFSANLKWVEPFGALLTATAINNCETSTEKFPLDYNITIRTQEAMLHILVTLSRFLIRLKLETNRGKLREVKIIYR